MPVFCNQPIFYVSDNTDCNDGDYINPNLQAKCNEIDDNCDENIDEEAIDRDIFYIDFDGDGFGHFVDSTLHASSRRICFNNSDCNDASPNTFLVLQNWTPKHPMQDNDNDGFGDNFLPSEALLQRFMLIINIYIYIYIYDDSDAIDQNTWYHDADNDGFGNITNCSINQTDGFVSNHEDCDDENELVSQGTEICDGIDNNCDNQTDEIGSVDGNMLCRHRQ